MTTPKSPRDYSEVAREIVRQHYFEKDRDFLIEAIEQALQEVAREKEEEYAEFKTGYDLLYSNYEVLRSRVKKLEEALGASSHMNKMHVKDVIILYWRDKKAFEDRVSKMNNFIKLRDEALSDKESK